MVQPITAEVVEAVGVAVAAVGVVAAEAMATDRNLVVLMRLRMGHLAEATTVMPRLLPALLS
jgi:hypothetical protein